MAVIKVLLLLLGLIAFASAQNDTTTEDMEPTTMEPTTMEPTTMAPTDEAPTNMSETAARYAAQEAMMTRNNHFYCLGLNSTRADFRSIEYRWGIWLQYPVLSYLDTMRKRHLMYAIAQMIGVPNLNDICIAEVEQYGVATYRESVFIKLYIRGVDTVGRVMELDSMFASRFAASNDYVGTFLGQLAINVSSTNPGVGPNLNNRTVNDSVHPGCSPQDCPEGDPTLLAVVIGTYNGKWYTMVGGEEEEVTIENLEAGIAGYRARGSFVNNPRPINFGLEAGDIIFAVFGSILLLVLSFGIVLGYFIHPFYLS